MLNREILVPIDPTPEELAFEFVSMNDSQQAAFFNELATLTAPWDRDFCFQLQYITDHPDLTDEGRSIMREIGERGLNMDEREITLTEWCQKLPADHSVNYQLAVLKHCREHPFKWAVWDFLSRRLSLRQWKSPMD